MEHSFDISVAKEYGILAAVLIRNFQYWISKNKSEKVNYINGHYWTYNSTAGLCELFPYASKDQINRQINNLVDKGVLVKGHHGENPNDRRTWIAFSDEAKWISQYREMDLANSRNGFSEIAKCNISNDIVYTNNKPNNKPNIKETIKEKFNVNDDYADVVMLWLDYKKDRRESYKSDKTVATMVKNLTEYSNGDADVARQIVEQSIANNWAGIFPLKVKDTKAKAQAIDIQAFERPRSGELYEEWKRRIRSSVPPARLAQLTNALW